MKILMIRSNAIDPDSRVEKEAASLIRLGHHVEILGWDRSCDHPINKVEKEFNDCVLCIHRIGISATFGGGFKKNIGPLLKFQREIYRFIKNYKKEFDVIHACDFDTAYISFKAAKRFHLKFIYDIFDYYIDSFSVPYFLRSTIKKMDFNIMNRANAIIICSEKRLQQIHGTRQNKICIIHNTPDNGNMKTNRTFDVSVDKMKIAYVGILSESRMLLELAETVHKHPEFELHIGGFGVLEKQIQKMSNENENITFYGKLEYADTLCLEKSCDIMVAIYDPKVPNHFYAAPNKFYEALMLGKPVIMVKNTGMDEVIEKNQLGEVIEFTQESLEKALLHLQKIKGSWDEISNKMQTLYHSDYSWLEMENRLEQLYKQIS